MTDLPPEPALSAIINARMVAEPEALRIANRY